MPYARQDFSSGAVLTAAQADQIEENIAAHSHGVSSVSMVDVYLGLRGFLYGVIQNAGAGSIVAGSFFAYTRVGTGDFTITFSKAYTALPAILATAQKAGAGANPFRFSNYITSTLTTANIQIFNTVGAFVDTEVSFLATGKGD